ncbi:MAG: ornithine carbamoyltransferase [Candidatus Competibacterales bacterium]
MTLRHFLNLSDLTPGELDTLLTRAATLKTQLRRGERRQTLAQQVLALVFEKASTRTRVSFEAGMIQLGGNAMFISPRDSQLGRGEPVEDTARVLSGMVDLVVVRTFEHQKLVRFAGAATVPVINGLTDYSHPCQLLADLLTYREERGSLRGATVAWIGDGNNMCNSYIEAAGLEGFTLRIACPEGFEPDAELCRRHAERLVITREPLAAATGAQLVTTDVWASMGQEEQQDQRRATFAPFQVNEAVMAAAHPEALFLHCLPAHRGEEVSAEVIDGPQSRVWEQATNRLHAQKALLEWLRLGSDTAA